MKKLLAVLVILCLLCVNAYADQADDLIATLTESDRASVSSALSFANLTHRDGDPYIIKIRTKEGTEEYTFSEEEYNKLRSWVDGEYTAPKESGLSDMEATNQWKNENGYDFPIYGYTSVNLSPISEYLTLLSDNGIYLTLPDLVISHDHEEYEWIYSQISDSLYLRYMYYKDNSKCSLCFEAPYTYKPIDEAFALLIASMCSISQDEARDIYSTAQYNVIDGWCTIESDDYSIIYYEPRYSNGQLAGFASLTVEKSLK